MRGDGGKAEIFGCFLLYLICKGRNERTRANFFCSATATNARAAASTPRRAVSPMPRHFARPHIGRVPMKFYFRAQDINIQLPGHDASGKLVVVWKRGPRRTETGPIEVKEQLSSVDGSLRRTATTLQDLAIICTMFKNVRTGGFESKSASFSLREEDEAGEETKLGTVTIDLSAYASPETTADPVELSFMQGKVLLTLTLSSHWLKHAAAASDDDGASVSSIGSFASERPDDESDGPRPSAEAAGAAAGGVGGSTYTPLGAGERARFQAWESLLGSTY